MSADGATVSESPKKLKEAKKQEKLAKFEAKKSKQAQVAEKVNELTAAVSAVPVQTATASVDTTVKQADFLEVLNGFNDVLNLYYQIICRQPEFREFMTLDVIPSARWDWDTGRWKKSIVFMVLSSFGMAWDVMRNKVKEVHGAGERDAAEKTYGLILGCFIVTGSLKYTVNGKAQDERAAKEASANKLRDAIVHGHFELTVVEKTPWLITFQTDYEKKVHSFQVTTSGLNDFFSVFSACSRAGSVTRESIRRDVELLRDGDECPEKFNQHLTRFPDF